VTRNEVADATDEEERDEHAAASRRERNRQADERAFRLAFTPLTGLFSYR
jgi:hypothetical protein